MVPEDSPITKASDLVGKTVGVPDASDESRLAYMLQVADVDSTKVKALPIGGRAPAAIEMRAGRVDAFMGSYVDRMAIRTQGGLPVRDIETVPAEGTFNNCIMVRQDDLADDERRGELVGLMRALAKAATVQFEDPELAIKVLGENHPEAYEDADDALALMRAAAEVERPAYDNKWASTPDKWQEFLDTFIEEGSVDKAYDVGPYIDGSLLEEIWDFDKDEVLEQARAQQ
jgi:ABC-type nitrate/sulfonate/bicarbonate transport system substrate-binding protein